MDSDEHPSIDDRNGLLATFVLSPLVSSIAMVAFAAFVLPPSNLYLVGGIALFAGLLGSSSGEPFFDALVRAVICCVPIAGLWYATGLTHWFPQAMVALFVGVAVGGVAFGLFRELTGR